MPVRRYCDPVFLQYIWNALESSKSDQGCNLEMILSTIQATYDPKCSPAKLHHELTNAVHDGCVKKTGEYYSLIPRFEYIQKDRSDWYCYECHAAGLVVACPTCFRVYHSECISAAEESHLSCRLPLEDPTVGSKLEPESEAPPKHPCPVCKRLQRAANTTSDKLTADDLHKIFLTAFESIRHRVNWKTLQKVGYLYEPQRNEYLVYEQINTRIIGDRLRSDPLSANGYSNRTKFLVDLDDLTHNTAVFYGNKHAITNMARQVRSHLRRSMRESTYCIDCYIRPASMSPVARLTSPCRKAHRLLWFQHNGWSFRPCKMLYESSEGYEVVCFGGRHEREFVPRSRAFDMTFTAPDLGLRMTPSLKKALDEAEEYKANQSAFNRNLPLAIPKENFSFEHSKIDKRSTSSSGTHSKTSSVGRKRKAGPKYTSTFGSTDTESVSSSFTSSTKRRKSNSTVKPGHNTNNVMPYISSSVIPQNYDAKSISSLSSASDYSDDEHDTFLPTNGKNKCKPNSVHRFKTGILESAARQHSHTGALSSASSTPSIPSTTRTTSTGTTKPIIRIKPLPLRPENKHSPSQSSSRLAGDSHAKTRAPASSSSCSSKSGPSSGCATIPALGYLEQEAGSSSRDSSVSSQFSSHLVDPDSKRPRLTIKSLNPAISSKLKSSQSSKASNSSLTSKSVKRTRPPTGPRLSESSSDESDSSVTSSALSDSSTSSVLSSSTVSSDSTLPSLPTRQLPLPAKASAFSPNQAREANFEAIPKAKRNGVDQRLNVDYCVSTKPVSRVKPQTVFDGVNDEEELEKSIKVRNQSHTPATSAVSTTPTLDSVTRKPPKNANVAPPTMRLPISTPSGRTPQITTNTAHRPTPPFSSSSSSWHSSVSPAALSTTSGIGSSLSDPKSVDASPGEVATLLGNTSFNSQSSVQTITAMSESALYKSTEEHIHRYYRERLAVLTAERDQAREELARRDALIEKLRADHEAEVKRVKQLTWCQICLGQAYYHCCPGTAYCSEACQLKHWTDQHNRECRRRGE